MIKSLIRFSAENRALVLIVTFFAVLAGVWSLRHIPTDAIPDLSDTQVIVYSKWDRSPDLVENQVTYPIVAGLLGAPKVKTVRGLSDFGFSYVYVIFEDGTDLYWARSRVLEFLSRITPNLPEGVKTELGPDATSVGWVYQYALKDESGRLGPADLRTLQDWTLRYHLQAVPGVSEVASIGGFVKQYQVQVDPIRLQNFHLSFEDVLKAVKNSNQESGGRVIEFSGTEGMVRSRGLIRTTTDISEAVVQYNPRTRSSILVKDIANVQLGPEMRRGVADLDGTGDTVGGIIVMRQGENTPDVIRRVKERLQELEPSLPPGVKVITTYDRSDLIQRAMDTLKRSLFEELIIVSLVILLFLWHIPSAIVPIVTIPVAVILAFIPLYVSGQTSNIMSLAGIAISIGVLVDGAIVEVENAYRKIHLWEAGGRQGDFHRVRLEALLEVGPSVFFSLLVIAVAFLPVFTLVDQEGRLFRPLALSKNLSMAIAAVLAVTLDPAMRMLFSRADPIRHSIPWVQSALNAIFVGTYHAEEKHPISRRLFRLYEPAVHWVLEKRKWVLIAAGVLTLSAIPGYRMLGSEFMPTLHEGSLLYMPTALPGLSVPQALEVLKTQDAIIKSFPEVERVFGKAGRAETSTDTAPISMVETTILLKARSQWPRPDETEERLIERMNEKLQFPGMPNIWTMPIKNRIDMLSTGIRSALGVKIFGADLKIIEKIGREVEESLRGMDGARTVVAERAASGYFIDVDFDRRALQAIGMSLKDAQDQAMMMIGGENVSTSLFSRERYPIQVRLQKADRDSLEAIERAPLRTPMGALVQIREVAEVSIKEGPGMIRNENALPVGYVFVDVDTTKTDIGSFVNKAKGIVREKVKLPTGYSISWSGQFENMERVGERLKVVIPVTLFLIAFLLYFNTKSWVKTGIVLLAVPFSLIGAVWFMWALGYHSSIATWVGMIALMGLDAETGVFMLMYLDLAHEDRIKSGRMNSEKDLIDGIVEGAVHRVRPKMMTVMALFLGLIPIMWSSGAGADVMKRIAAPMIGGLATSFLLELLIYPVLFFEWKRKELKNP